MTIKLLRFLLLGLVPAALCLGSEIDSLIRNAPGIEQYPDAGALVLLDRRTMTVDRNNNAVTERYLVVKILDDRGRDDLGDQMQRYNKDGQVCEVLTALTHKPNGAVVKPEARAISDVSAPEVAEAPVYTNAMQKVVSFPALEKDAVIEYRVRLRPKKGAKETGFGSIVRFGGYYPALRREFRLVLPNGSKWTWAWSDPLGKVPAGAGQPAVESTATGVSYAWTLDNTERIRREPASPALDAMIPRLVFSSYDSWAAVAKELTGAFGKGLVPAPDVKALATELSAGKSKPEALESIFLYVTQNIRNVNLDYGDAGYEPHAAAQVLQWKYGDCRDKNCLLIALLREAGINCFPVVLRTDRVPVQPSVPIADAFDWLATRATIDSVQYLLDPFAEYVRSGTVPQSDADCDGLYLDSATSELTLCDKTDAERNLSRTVADLALSMDGTLAGTVTTATDGCFDNWLRENWRDETPDERRREMAQNASYLRQGATVDSFTFSDLKDLTVPAEGWSRFTAPGFAASQKGELSLRVPMLGLAGEPVFGQATAAARRNPFNSPPERVSTYECSITLPKGAKPDILPEPYFKENQYCRASARWERTAAGVAFRQEFALKADVLSPAAYSELKAVTDALARPQLRDIYFLK